MVTRENAEWYTGREGCARRVHELDFANNISRMDLADLILITVKLVAPLHVPIHGRSSSKVAIASGLCKITFLRSDWPSSLDFWR